MKRMLVFTLLMALVLGLGVLGYYAVKTLVNTDKTEEGIKHFPDFQLQKLDGTSYSSKNVPTGYPVLIVYFNPSCDHCQQEATALAAHTSDLKEVNILMITTAAADEAIAFYEQYKLNQLSMVEMLLDNNHEFKQYFGEVIYPTVLLYNTSRELELKQQGGGDFAAILKLLKLSSP